MRGATRPTRGSSKVGLLPSGHGTVGASVTGYPRGSELAPEDQAVAARFMECFAAYLSYTDAQIWHASSTTSRETGDLDNTVTRCALL